VDASLARLKTHYIDLLQIHRYDRSTPAEETMKALHDLVQAGKVRYIGGSSMRCWEFARLNEVADKHGWTQFVSMQDEYSLLYREEVGPLDAAVAGRSQIFPSKGARDAGLLQVQRHRRHSLGSSRRR
jgi:aryl-alcohol dehydrogenase-like predicted oxidoreductase